jgi:hypothetical protein
MKTYKDENVLVGMLVISILGAAIGIMMGLAI